MTSYFTYFKRKTINVFEGCCSRNRCVQNNVLLLVLGIEEDLFGFGYRATIVAEIVGTHVL